MIDRDRRAWLRFLIVVAAAALGETIGIWQRLPSSSPMTVVAGLTNEYSAGITMSNRCGCPSEV